ncbi:DNA primase [Patescibacteria group bacterium]
MSSPIEQIKQRLTVVDVVGSYIKLQKAGVNHKACCPFHSEKAPSFYVSPPREMWHCFGCNRGGDIFEFVKQIEGVEFPEALRILADRAGITVTYQSPEFRDEKTKLLDILKDSAYFYQKHLTENGEVLNYLWKRGIKNDTIKNFNIGFAPLEENGWRHLFSYLKSKGYDGEEMVKAGLVIKKENSTDYYDRFRGRVMFPLKDGSGRVVGFSGRIYGEEKEGVGKYINTPQTILYDKSKVLYGFDRAKMEIRKKDSCVLVEGQMDVVMSHQAGVENAVAVSGTALTNQHLEMIKRLTENLVMAFDSDDAGLTAARRSIDLALENNFEVLAVSMPKDKDPAEIILETPDKWQAMVEGAVHIIEFYLSVLKEKHGKGREFKKAVEKEVLPYILHIKSGVDRSHWMKKIAKELDVSESIISEELKKVRIGKKDSPIKEEKVEQKDRKIMLREKLAGISLWKKDKELIPEFAKKEVEELLRNLKKEEKEKMSFEAEIYCGGIEDIEAEIKHIADQLQKETIKEKLESLAEEVRRLENEGKTEELEKKMNEFRTLSQELAGV